MTGSAEQTPARFPDFFIVGHSKSGTTALYEMLRAHPQIFMPDLKEPTYFATDLRPRVRQPVPEPETEREYLALFAAAGPGQVVGEASSLYLWSAAAAGEIAKVAPRAKIVAIFREPVSFLRSLHLQLVQNRNEDQLDLRAALALEDERRQGRRIPASSARPQALLYSERVRYVEQLRRYDAHFPREQLLVLIYDDFRADNEATVRRVLRFLDVDEAMPLASLESNPSVGVRSVRLQGLARRLGALAGPRARRALAPLARRAVYREPPPADPELTLELRRRFKGEVQALGEYLERDLVTLWGYDAVG